MRGPLNALSLLRDAEIVYDRSPALASAALPCIRHGFKGGGQWMQSAIENLRAASIAGPSLSLHRVGFIKYSTALVAAFAAATLLYGMGNSWPLLLVVCALAFYAIEVQMAFVFPLSLDGCARPFRQSRHLIVRAGGTWPALRIVVPLALYMLCGGLLGRGFVRSWCLGCLAICIWYESIRQTTIASGSIRVRSEVVAWETSADLLYASDLHLGRWWTTPLADRLELITQDTKPDAVLLGGDLVDRIAGLKPLASLVKKLSAICPVFAVGGNHDLRVGLTGVEEAVEGAGGIWLRDQPRELHLANGRRIWLHGVAGKAAEDNSRSVLVAHDPAIFPEALAAGYRLVLAGHLHGGQCVLATRKQMLYPGAFINRWTGLRFERGASTMLVSRGAADTLPLRWNCPREVIVCQLRAPEDSHDGDFDIQRLHHGYVQNQECDSC